uniref:Uncharacterized protein n=1 Tax=viral metagenome TaxID=1070528 RepID=A0A6C0HNW6_9ZZZZ
MYRKIQTLCQCKCAIVISGYSCCGGKPPKFLPKVIGYPLNAYQLYIADGVIDVIQPENYVFRRYLHNQD